MKKNNDTKDSPKIIKNNKKTNENDIKRKIDSNKKKVTRNKKDSNKNKIKTNTNKISTKKQKEAKITKIAKIAKVEKETTKKEDSIEKVDLIPVDRIIRRRNIFILIRNKVKRIAKNPTVKAITKRIASLVAIAVISSTSIALAVTSKYKPVYIVRENDEIIGYVSNREEFEKRVNSEVLSNDNICAISTTLNTEPTYELKFLEDVNLNEDEIISRLKSESTTLYKVYAIVINGEEKTYVKTWEEAENIVNQMNAEFASLENVTVTAIDKYTEDIMSIGTVELADATTSVNSELRSIEAEQKRIAAATVNGVYLSVKPVANCTITSRYGVFESSVRNHAHGGIDLAASYGTTIRAAAAGTIKVSEYYGGYGNLIIIDHGNGVETYYGHCSKLYARVGQWVEAGDSIAAVGSTGNSTGNHCHFEVRINGSTVNPQKYMYN